MKTFPNHSALLAFVGQSLPATDWLEVTQAHINLFADATGDHQWIHIDQERAAQGPFGSTIAHGFLTLSLLPRLMQSSYAIEGTRMGVNYGLNRVRFPAPVPVGSRLRGHAKLLAAESIAPDGVQMTWEVTIEREGSDKPVCVAESIVRSYGAAA